MYAIRNVTFLILFLTTTLFIQSCKNASTLTSSGLKSAAQQADLLAVTLTMKSPAVVEVNQCVPLVISLKNSLGDQVAASKNLSIQILGNPTPLYSDTGCSVVQSSTMNLLKGALTKVIYVRPASSQSYIFEMQEATAIVNPSSFILSISNPVSNVETLKLTFSGPSSLVAGQCRSYVVSLQNNLGANKNSTSNMAIALSGEGAGGQYFAGTNCAGGAISSVTLLNGQSFVSLSYKNSVAENVNLVADSPAGSSIQSSFYSVQVNPISTALPTQLVLSGPTTVTAGACSGPVVVKTVDASFNSTATAANLNFTISGGAGFSVFSNASCSTSLVSPLISASSSSTSFYFIAASAGNFVVAADDGGSLTDGSLSVQASATAGTSAVKFTLSGPSTVLAQSCSSAFVVKTTNGSGIDSPVNATTTVNITGKGTGDFYADSACTSMISSLTFAAGDSSKPFYYKEANVANLTFNVDDAGPLTPASTSVSIVPGAATKLVVAGATPITLGECRAYTVTSKDANNFVSTVSGTTSINLTGAGAGVFYTDSSCVNSTSSVVINSGQSAALFYFKTLTAAAVTLSADNSGGLTAGTQAVVIDPLPYSKVVLSRPVLTAGVCTAVTLTLKDTLNNSSLATSSVGVALTTSGGATFYTASNCLTSVTSANILTGQSNVTVYLKDAVAENITLGASSAGLTSDSWNTNVLAGSNNTLKLIGPATNSVGSCSAYDLRLEDSLGNLSSASSSTSINFTGLSNAKFYSDVNCTIMASSITLATGNSQTQIYLKGNVAESLTIGASSGALVAASKAVSLIAGTSNKLVLTGSASEFAGNCSALTVGVQDSFNNFIAQGSNFTVTLSGNGGGSYYSNSGCTISTSTAVVTTGNSTASVWFKSNIPSALSLVAQGSGVFDAALSLTINPLAPSKLVLTGSASITSGICNAYSVSLQDTLNNLSAAGTSKTLNFSGALAGAFYSDSNCSLPTTSITVTSTQTTAQIYYKASAAQTPNLSVDDSGLPDLAASILPVTVTSGAGATTIALKISGASSIYTNTCVPYAIMTTDTSGLSYNVTSNMTVTVGGAGTGVFYSDSGCSSAASTVTVTSGSSLSYIYYNSASAQNLVFSATASGASTTTLPVAVQSGAGPATASRLTIVGSTSILTNSCIPYVVSVTDANGNSINAVTNTAVTLTGGGSGSFFTENTCTTSAAGAATVTAGTSYTTVYYSNGTVQNLILIAQSTGLSNGTLALAVSSVSGGAVSGPAVKLSFIAQPSSVSSTNENFGVQPIVAVQDSNNNVASSASNTITLAAYTDSNCSLSAGGIIVATTNPLNANGGVANFAGVNSTSAQIIYLRASSPGLASACSQSIQVYPAVAAKLSFSQQPSGTATAGANLAVQPQVSILNYTNQVVTTATNIVTIGAFTDNSCTTPVSGTFNISANNLIPSSGMAAFSGVNYSLPSTIYLKASSSGLTSACSSGITVSPAAPYMIGIYTQPSTTGTVGANLSMTVRLYDVYGSLSPAAHNLSLTAYKSSNCTGTTSTITGNTTTSTVGSATFSAINFTEADTMSIKVTDSTNPSVLSVCSNAIVVDGGTPSKLVFSVQPSATGRIYTSLVTSPVVQVQDSLNNLVKGSVNQVTLSAFTNAGCTVAASGTLFSTSSLTVTPSYGIVNFPSISYSTNQTIYLKATAAGLTSACSDPIVISGMPKKISANEETTCAVMDGSVWCWGVNSYNRLGNGLGGPSHAYPAQVVGVGGVGYLANISDVAVGYHHVCALSTAGAVYCWGRNDYGQIGDNTVTTRTTPVQVLGVGATGTLSSITSISAGYLHSCALNSSGNVFCWGYNGHGQMGDNTTTARYTPVQVKGVGNVGNLSSITAISSSDYHECALSSAGEVYCWGYNGYGQMGVNNGTAYNTPVKVLGVGAVGNLSNITQISAGGHGSYGFNCAVNNVGDVFCWGYGGNGELGDNTATSKSVPVKVVGVSAVGYLANISSVSAGGYHACAINTSGATYCWGYNAQGQLGDNTTVSRNTPALVLGVGGTGNLSPQIALATGSHFSCSLAADGLMYCWGQNNYGQLGDQTFTYRSVPVKVRDINNSYFTSVSVGHYNVCGVAREKAYCWGYAGNGELGDGTNTSKVTPSLVSNLTGVKQVSMGQNHGCALTKTGEVYCWGYNAWGQLGDNSTLARNTPIQVLGVGGVGYLTNIISISAANWHTCAVNSSGATFCWGNNGNGQLGDNTLTERRTPVQVLGENGVGYLSNITSVTTGYWHTCAMSGSGAAYCWGYNGYNQLGDNTSTLRMTPVQVLGLSSGVTAISAGSASSCAIKGGAGYCWGYNTYGNTNTYYSISAAPSVIWPSGVTSIAAGTETVSAVVNKKVKAYSVVAYYAYHEVGAAEVFNDVAAISENHVVYGHPMYCATKTSGAIYCWGYNANVGLFNSGSTGSFVSPSAIIQPTITDIIHSNVATGETHSCGNINGIAQCWGTSSVGALGTGGSNSLYPKPVLLNSDSSRLGGQASFGAGSAHSCSLSYSGEVNCWGDNTYGKLGNNSSVATNKAVQVKGIGGTGILNGVSSLSVGYRHTCTTRLGGVYCWGYNLQGQLGIDSTMSMGTPVQVKGVGGTGYLTGTTQVAAGRAHSCAIKAGYVYCWGSNQYGQLGANSGVSQSNTPLQVVSVSGMGVLDNVTSITAGAYHTCALSGGITYCWGANAGKQLGNDSFTDSSYPVGVMNSGYVTLTGVSSISAGAKHTCATTSASEVFCWGTGTAGQLGNNFIIDIGVATTTVGVGAVGDLSAGVIGSGSSSNHTCAISGDQASVYCWGEGSAGQLGNGSTPASQASPVNTTSPTIINLLIK